MRSNTLTIRSSRKTLYLQWQGGPGSVDAFIDEAKKRAGFTDKIQQEVSTGTSLTAAMGNANIFPSMVLQMCAIGEESGSIDHMLGKAADFYEAEVDDMVAGLSSLMEPIIIVFLGTLIGGIVVSMYLPIFKLGQVV